VNRASSAAVDRDRYDDTPDWPLLRSAAYFVSDTVAVQVLAAVLPTHARDSSTAVCVPETCASNVTTDPAAAVAVRACSASSQCSPEGVLTLKLTDSRPLLPT
jgi:hypothetical protein